jgi:signal transduction histidine kinase
MLRTHQQVFSLRDALQTLVERTQSEHLRIDLCFEGTEQDVSAQAIMTLYRVAQEGLTNVQRHARAGHVTITAQLSVHEARLSIADDGSGFDSTRHNNQTTGRWGGYGLRGVQERLELVAGSLEITTQPGRGTQLIAVVPRSPVARSAGHVLAPRGGQP